MITQLLAQGKEVRAIIIKHRYPDFHSPHLQQIQCDVLDTVGLEEAMQNVEQVHHCAAIITFAHRRRTELFKVNVEGTANVVNAALDAGVKKNAARKFCCYIGRTKGTEPVNETTSWNEEANYTNYAESKYLSELEVWRGIGEGLEAVIVNPTIILGAGDWQSSSTKIFKNVYQNFPGTAME